MPDGFDDSAMIALLPIVGSYSRLELPHLTLVYAGLTSTLRPDAFNEMSKDAASIAMMASPITLRTLGVEEFGTDVKVKVLAFRNTPELQAMRRVVEHWNASEHVFNPHSTIGTVEEIGNDPIDVPMYVAFDRLSVNFGSESIVFWLNP